MANDKNILDDVFSSDGYSTYREAGQETRQSLFSNLEGVGDYALQLLSLSFKDWLPSVSQSIQHFAERDLVTEARDRWNEQRAEGNTFGLLTDVLNPFWSPNDVWVSLLPMNHENTVKNDYNALNDIKIPLSVFGLSDITAQGVLNQTAAMLPSIALGGNAGLLEMGLSAAGQSTNEALSDGASLDKAVAYGTASGAVEMATEKIGDVFGFFGGGFLDNIAKPSTVGGKLLLNALGESGEEVASEVVNPLLRGIYDPYALDAYTTREGRKQLAKDVADAGIMGGVSSLAMAPLGMGSNNTIRESLANRQTYENRLTDLESKGKLTEQQEAKLSKNISNENATIEKHLQKLTAEERTELLKEYPALARDFDENGRLKTDVYDKATYQTYGANKVDLTRIAQENGVKLTETLDENQTNVFNQVKQKFSQLKNAGSVVNGIAVVDDINESDTYTAGLYTVSNNTILINSKRLNEFNDALETLMHESSHALTSNGTKALNLDASTYRFYRSAISNMNGKAIDEFLNNYNITEEQLVSSMEKVVKGEKMTAKESEIVDEAVAHITEYVLGNESSIDRIVAENENTITSLYTRIHDAVQLHKSVKGLSGELAKRVKDNYKTLRAFEKAFAESLERNGIDVYVNDDDEEEETQDIKTSTKMTGNAIVEETKDLVAVHNLTQKELESTLALGGFPMPSIAIVKAKGGHTQYGDISVVFDKDTIDPRFKDNKVYGADAWTPTFPQINYKVVEGTDKLFQQKIDRLISKYGDEASHLRHYSELDRDLSYYIDNEMENADMIQIFLQETGKGKVDDVVVEKEATIPQAAFPLYEAFNKNLSDDFIEKYENAKKSSIFGGAKKFFEENYEQIKEAYVNAFAEVFNITEEQRSNLMNGIAYEDVRKNFILSQRFKKGIGTEKTYETDYIATRKKILDTVDKAEYRKWLEDLFDGIQMKSGISNGKDPYDSRGNRRSWEQLNFEATLDNIVTSMRSQEEVGAAAIITRPASLLGAKSKQYKSLQEIKNDSYRLGRIDDETYKSMQNDFNRRLHFIADEIAVHSKYGNTFIENDDAANLIFDAADKYSTASGIYNYIKKYNNKITMDLANDIVSLVKDVSQTPVGYFEAKPRRAVSLDEVKYIIAPESTSESVLEQYRKNGATVLTFKDGDDNERTRILSNLDDVKFSKKLTENDKQYLALAENPEQNESRLREMVEEAAKKAGYNSPDLYHGTRHFGFTKFNTKAIFTSTRREVSANYAGDDNYAFVREVNKKLRGGNSLKDIIFDAEQVYGTKLKGATESDKKSIYEEYKNKAIEFADERDKIYDNLPDNMPDDVYASIDKIESIIWEASSENTFDEVISDTEHSFSKSLQKYLDSYRENANTVRNYFVDNFNELTTNQKKALNFYINYDFSDFVIELNDMVLATNGEAVLINERGNLTSAESVREDIDKISNIGSYHLYGNVGNNPFEFDAEGASFFAVKVKEMGSKLYDTDQIVTWAKSHGYTSVIMKNIRDYGELATNYVFFNSSQVKSADPVTYDKNGDIIPLSERFNEGNDDIRYSLKQLGYHAGDLGKAEPFSQIRTDAGSTGHFGTGTYFVSNIDKISDYSYGKRPKESVDFSKYNLYKPKSNDDGYKLHDLLRDIDTYYDYKGIQSMDEYERLVERYREYEYDDDMRSALRIARQILNTSTFEKDFNDAVRRISPYYYSIGDDGNMYYYDKSKGDSVMLTEEEYNSLIENSDFRSGYFNDDLESYYAYRDIQRYEDFKDSLYSTTRSLFGISSVKTDDILDSVNEYAKNLRDSKKNLNTSDTPGTMFMKKLGYEGIDVSGLSGLDNTTFGSVIYDLKGEDLDRKKEIGTARFSKKKSKQQIIDELNYDLEKMREGEKRLLELARAPQKANSYIHRICILADNLRGYSDHKWAKEHGIPISQDMMQNDQFNALVKQASSVFDRKGMLNANVIREKLTQLADFFNEENQIFQDFMNDIAGGDQETADDYIETLQESFDTLNEGYTDELLSMDEIIATRNILSIINMMYLKYNAIYEDGVRADANELANKYQDIQLISRNIYQSQGGMLGKIQEKMRSYETFIESPTAVAQMMDGYKDGFFSHYVKRFRADTHKMNNNKMRIMADMEAFLKKDKKFIEHLNKDTVTIRGKQIFVGEAIDIWLQYSQENGRLTISGDSNTGREGAGFTYTDTETGKKANDTIHAAEAHMQEMYDSLSAQDKEFIKLLKDVFHEGGKLKAEADMKKVGYTDVKDGYSYYQLTRDQEYLRSNIGDSSVRSNVQSVFNFRINKKRSKHAMMIPLQASNAITKMQEYVRQTTMYNAFGEDLSNFKRLYNKNTNPEGKAQTLRIYSNQAWNDSEKYWEKYLNDIQGVSNKSHGAIAKWTAKIRSNFAQAQLGANIKVVAGQFCSYPTAMVFVDPDSMLKSMVMKVDYEGMDEYSQLAKFRNKDDTVFKAQSLSDKVTSFGALGSVLIGKADRFTVGHLWTACQLQVEKNTGHKVGTEANKELAGEMFDECVSETQPTYQSSDRSAFQRTDNELMKFFAMFTSVPMKQVSLLISSANRLMYEQQLKKRGIESDVKSAKNKFLRTMASVTLANAMYAVVVQLVKHILAKDDDEDNNGMNTLQQIMNQFLETTVSMFPFIKEIYGKIRNGYDIEINIASTLNQFIDDITSLFSVDSVEDANRAARTILFDLGTVLGIPVRNAYNQMFGLFKRFDRADWERWESNFNENHSYSARIRTAIENGDDRLLNTYISIQTGNEGLPSVYNALVKEGYDVLPRSVGKTITIDGEQYDMSRAEQKKFKSIYYGYSKTVSDMTRTNAYKSANNDVRASAINMVNDIYWNMARDSVTGEDSASKNVLFAQAIELSKLAIAVRQCQSITADTDRNGKPIANSRKIKVQKTVNAMNLTVAQKYILMAYLGYRNTNGEQIVKNYVYSIKGMSKQNKDLLWSMCGY